MPTLAYDVAATYLTLRLEDAQRHTGVELIDPVLQMLLPGGLAPSTPTSAPSPARPKARARPCRAN
jgi:hypothetical protein